jgi:hypothetical protein
VAYFADRKEYFVASQMMTADADADDGGDDLKERGSSFEKQISGRMR